MSDTSQPTLADISRALAHLADRVLVEKRPALDPFISNTLRLVTNQLEMLVPGLEAPVNAEAARAFREASEIARRDGEEIEAMSYALRGLSCSPHDPQLWYLAGAACVEIGGLECAMRLMFHALWINPGHPNARRDLEALTSFLGEEGDTRAA